MPVDYKLYPANWEQIRSRILTRDGHRCACAGQCGDSHDGGRCNVPNGATIQRDPECPARWVEHRGCSLCLGGDPECRSIKVVLTIAHYPDPTPSNCSDENLFAGCQRCHNLIDLPMRREHARATRMARKAVGYLRGVG
jgi:hypothetical protein